MRFFKYYPILGVLVYVHPVRRVSLEGVMAHISVACISEMSGQMVFKHLLFNLSLNECNTINIIIGYLGHTCPSRHLFTCWYIT